MNPMDFILLIVSITVAVLSVVAQGWTVQGIGPAIFSMAGGIWQCWMQWLRHRNWLRIEILTLYPARNIWRLQRQLVGLLAWQVR